MKIKKPTIYKVVAGTAAAAVAVTVLGGATYTLDEGVRGVILRNGKVVGIAEPGLGIKVPLIDRVTPISVQNRSRIYKDLPAYSSDQQNAVMQVSVNFRVPPDKVDEVYKKYGSIDGMLERLIDRQMPDLVKTVFGKFTAAEAIRERERLTTDLSVSIRKGTVGPLIIEGVQIEGLKFSANYEQGVEQRMLAEVEVEKVRQTRERERVQAEILVIQAKAVADSNLAKAQAEADAIRLTGEATAKAIEMRGRALAQNSNLVDLVKAERWDGKLPTTMPGATVPMINLK